MYSKFHAKTTKIFLLFIENVYFIKWFLLVQKLLRKKFLMKAKNAVHFYQKDMQKKQILKLFATIMLFETWSLLDLQSYQLKMYRGYYF